MTRRAKVELFEQLRREYEFGIGAISGVARKVGVHRRMVRQALASAIPPERMAAPRKRPKLEPVREFIDLILQADLQAPRKQRHTAHRIFCRLCEERPGSEIAERRPCSSSRCAAWPRGRPFIAPTGALRNKPLSKPSNWPFISLLRRRRLT